MMIDDDNIKVNVKSLRGACGDKIPTISDVMRCKYLPIFNWVMVYRRFAVLR